MVVTGGGTGGHLFPGIAVAEEILRRFPDGRVLFIGTNRLVDSSILNDQSFETTSIKSSGIKGMSFISRLKALLQIPYSVIQAAGILRRFKADLVLGVGGYVTGPVVLASRIMGVPACIHEQNSVPGMANRLLGHICNKVFLSIPGSEKYFPSGKTLLTGNPVRQELLKSINTQISEISSNDRKVPTLLILGGSQGAHRVNILMLECVKKLLSDMPNSFNIVHQTGSADKDYVKKTYSELGISADVSAFIKNMNEVYQKADLIISRAGATTLAELAVLGKPSILIPYPYAADNHQEKNGQYLCNSGGARMFIEAGLTGEKLAGEISKLLQDPESLKIMGEKIKQMGKPEATDAIVNQSLTLLGIKYNKTTSANTDV